MNEVYLEGTIVSLTPCAHDTPAPQHLMCSLKATHKTTTDRIKHEVYSINAWGTLAQWAQSTLSPNMRVLVKGYLTQQAYGAITATEITAKRFVIIHSQTSPHDSPLLPFSDKAAN